MTIDEAIQHCKEQVQEQAKKGCYSCAEEHQQLAEWLKELKAYKETWNKLGMWLADTRLAIAPDEFLNDVDEELVRVAQVDMIDTVLEWMDKQGVGMKLLIDIPEHIYEHAKESSEDSRDEFDAMRAIANGTQQESRSEIPNTCGDAVSRAIVKEEITKSIELKENPYQLWHRIQALPSVNPQQRTGRWRKVSMDKYIQHSTYYYECSECGDQHIGQVNYCPNCGAKMEVEE